jgi:hypothetical protein
MFKEDWDIIGIIPKTSQKHKNQNWNQQDTDQHKPL